MEKKYIIYAEMLIEEHKVKVILHKRPRERE